MNATQARKFLIDEMGSNFVYFGDKTVNELDAQTCIQYAEEILAEQDTVAAFNEAWGENCPSSDDCDIY
jgi:hypothetical protein